MKLFSDSLLFFVILIFLGSCQDNIKRDEIPRIYVYEEINLNEFKYQPLNLTGGYVYYDAGVRGIIIYKKSGNEYLAFERDCPFQPASTCAKVIVDQSTLFMIDTCCSSKFDFDGNPISGPVEFPLVQYKTFLNQNLLIISSD